MKNLPQVDLDLFLKRVERAWLEHYLRHTGHDLKRVSVLLNIGYAALKQRVSRLNLSRSSRPDLVRKKPSSTPKKSEW